MSCKAMKIIHVDTNIYAQKIMQEQIPIIVPQAELHCFNRPEPALAFAEIHGCDVLLTEAEFLGERLDGFRLAKAIREINPQVNIIFVTVCNECEVSRELSELCVNGFIPKPWEPEKLAAAFRSLPYPVNTRTNT